MRFNIFLSLALCVLLTSCSGRSSSPDAGAAQQPQVTQNIRFAASDGITLMVKVGGRGALTPRPLIVEFSPYDPGCCAEYAGPDYNYLQVHIRGTGDSDGSFDALGPKTQQDVIEVLDWACKQSWSNGVAGIYGFSASAITFYNTLHLKMPSCVKAAVMMAGTHELYRDLLYPGGIPNLAAGAFVLVGIGGPAASETFSRLARDPFQSAVDPTLGIFGVGIDYIQHPTLDDWWLERGMRGDVNHLPIMMITSFYDVEPRGPFQAFQELRGDGAHLLVVGAHDGAPVGTESLRFDEQKKWYDRYLKRKSNGVEKEPKVQMLMSNGDRLSYLAGDFVRYHSSDWPVPDTKWTALALDAATSDSNALSLNNGSLSLTTPSAVASQPYLELLSLPTETDQHTTAVIGSTGFGSYTFNSFLTAIPQLADMTLAEPLGLSYTSAPLNKDVLMAGPASLELLLSSVMPETDIYAVICDVSPDGSAHAVATGRLRTAYPDIDPAKSLHDSNGNVVQPYGVYATKTDATPASPRRYSVEFWPIGNRFKKGDRVRLDIVGVSAYHLPSVPSLNSVTVGGPDGSRLLLPVLPGSDLEQALGGAQ